MAIEMLMKGLMLSNKYIVACNTGLVRVKWEKAWYMTRKSADVDIIKI